MININFKGCCHKCSQVKTYLNDEALYNCDGQITEAIVIIGCNHEVVCKKYIGEPDNSQDAGESIIDGLKVGLDIQIPNFLRGKRCEVEDNLIQLDVPLIDIVRNDQKWVESLLIHAGFNLSEPIQYSRNFATGAYEYSQKKEDLK